MRRAIAADHADPFQPERSELSFVLAIWIQHMKLYVRDPGSTPDTQAWFVLGCARKDPLEKSEPRK